MANFMLRRISSSTNKAPWQRMCFPVQCAELLNSVQDTNENNEWMIIISIEDADFIKS